MSVTRNYGETAGDKASELILHLLIATLSVTVLIGIFLGWREALVVLVAVPVTLALTLFVYYAFGYTLNRITLFALIFSIGILVDDAIVVVENVYRHLAMGDRDAEPAALEAVDEVGNPTILATFTVIAAIHPMAFVSGLMGPYMRPIPVGASVAMLASLAVAFVVTPYLALRLLRGHVTRTAAPHDRAHEPEEAGPDVLRERGGAARPLGRSGAGAGGVGQDAALRQQERVPGHPRPARGRHARDEPGARAGGRRDAGPGARGAERRGVRRHGLSLQLQRVGASLLPAQRRERRRRAGEPLPQGRPRPPEPRDRRGRAPARGLDRRALRRARQDRRDPARTAGALDAGRRGVRRGRQHSPRDRAPRA